MRRVRVGINGFGRIGRITARQVMEHDDLELVIVNDIAEDTANLVYLYNYDSVYRRPRVPAAATGDGKVMIGDSEVRFTRASSTVDVPWDEVGVDVVIEASGVRENAARSVDIVSAGRVGKVIVTHSPTDSGIDRYIILGVNDEEYSSDTDHVISSSICDANAIAHPLKWIDEEFGVAGGFVTTIHPWLSYQNLTDAPLINQSNPGHYWKDYSLGRSSVGALIPKDTTAVDALRQVIPRIAERLYAFSYRVPTATVASADLSIKLGSSISTEELRRFLVDRGAESPFVRINDESLVSCDYIQDSSSAVIDSQWVRVNQDMAKIVLWYDNEWGYSARVVDLTRLVGGLTT